MRRRRRKLTWLASFPKSGNTWVRLFMQALHHGEDFAPARASSNQRQDSDIVAWASVAPVDYPELLSMEEHMALRPAALLHIAHQNLDETSSLVKTHATNGILSGMHIVPPALTARAVYIVRDPRDVVPSFADHFGQTLDAAIETIGHREWTLSPGDVPVPVAEWSIHVRSWIEEDVFPVLVVRYEDLRADPCFEFRRVLDFLEMEATDEQVAAAVEATRFERLQAYEAEHGSREKSMHSERFFRRGQVGGWRDTLTREQVARIEADHGAMMERLGYQLTERRVA